MATSSILGGTPARPKGTGTDVLGPSDISADEDEQPGGVADTQGDEIPDPDPVGDPEKDPADPG